MGRLKDRRDGKGNMRGVASIPVGKTTTTKNSR